MAKPRSRKRNRRVVGSRQYADYSEEMLQLAAENVRNGQMSSYEAHKMFKIPRRTILNRANNKHTKTPGGQIKLKPEVEKQFVNVLIAAADFGSPLTELDLRIVVYQYLKKNNMEHLFNGKMPGRWWVKNFLERYSSELTTRVTQNIKKVRAEKTESEFEEYFENLKNSVKDVPNTNILNFDETNFSDNPGNVKCIFKRKIKYPERIMNFTKGSISVMFAVTANGDCLPPYSVYKAENMWNLWRLNGPRGSRYNSTKSGWFDCATFQDWFETVILPWAKDLQGPKVIIGDNLSSHINVDIFELCQEHDIRFVFLPPNATHLAQPLDVSFFGPLKKQWRKILTQYKIDFPQNSALNKADFPALLKKLMENIDISKKENILSGFRTTGISPFNPAKVLRKLPTYEESIKYNVDETLLSYLKALRTPKATEKRRRNQKLAIPPGKSVEAQDIEDIIQNKTIKKKKNMGTQKKITIKPRISVKAQDMKNIVHKKTVKKRTEIDKQKDKDHTHCIADNLVIPLTSTNQDNLVMPSTSTSQANIVISPSISTRQNGTVENAKKITIVHEEVLKGRQLSNILKDVDVKTLKRREAICKPTYMDDSDTDVTDNYSLHDSEDSPMEDNISSEEEKIEIEEETIADNTEKEKDKTYLEKTKSDNTKEAKENKEKCLMEDNISSEEEKMEIEEETIADNTEKEKEKTYLEKTKSDNTKEAKEIKEICPMEDNISSEEKKMEIEDETIADNTEKDKTCLEKSNSNNTKEAKEIKEKCEEKIRIGSYLLVKFVTKKSTKFYIGEVMVIQDVGVTVKFLKKKRNNIFVWPIKDDVGFVLNSEIETILPSPQLLRRGMFEFKCDFNKFNIC